MATTAAGIAARQTSYLRLVSMIDRLSASYSSSSDSGAIMRGMQLIK